jgi:hypothetical protein
MPTPSYNPSSQTVRAKCAHCDGAYSVFQFQANANVQVDERRAIANNNYTHVSYMLFRCPGCGHGALAVIHHAGNPGDASRAIYLESFYPFVGDAVPLPSKTPKDIRAEFREAELCAAAGAYRAASALMRSTLEKTLKANGYTKGNDPKLTDLYKRIDAAGADGVITEARRKRAHENIRSLGNDVLHDDWQEVTLDEFEDAHHYMQRILEDLYGDRDTVERVLIDKKRIVSPTPAPLH